MLSTTWRAGEVTMSRNPSRRANSILLSLLVGLVPATVGDRAAADGPPPLTGLPSAPGKHVEKIEAMADNT